MGQSNVELTDEILNKWQNIVDLMARIMNVPTALIMRVDYPQIEVFKASSNPKNPYGQGDKENLAGLYCETVIKTQSKLLVPNALKDPDWKDNPDVELGMISYLGMPLNWPDGDVFGTICILDKEENYYSEEILMLLRQFRDMAEMHLALLYKNKKLEHSKENYKKAFNKLGFLKKILIHDIKNIFQGLKMNVSLFSKQIKEELFGDQKEILLHNLEEQIKKGMRLVSNVYTYTKLEKQQKELETINLLDYLDKSLTSLIKQFPKKDIQIQKNIEIENVKILANDFIEDLFDNILINAVKHNRSEIIKLWITVSHKHEDYFKIKFCDNGIGIPDKKKELIMNDNRNTIHNGTIRFGLLIIKKLVKRFNGELHIKNRRENDYTKGVCFIVLLPREI